MTIAHQDAKKAIRNVIGPVLDGRGEALLATQGLDGRPHMCWMGTLGFPEKQGWKLVTLTSPDSRKVRNIQQNPLVEWMFSDRAKSSLVYLQGKAVVVEDPASIKAGWAALDDKDKAYFLNFINSGIGFAVVETTIEDATLCIPRAGASLTVPWAQIVDSEMPVASAAQTRPTKAEQ